MKKPLLVLFLLFCCSLAPAAILCSSCGKDMPDKANFCPWCGTALPEATKPDRQVAREVSTPAGSVPIELSPSDYNYVSQMETMINANNHAVASREAPKFRTLHGRQMTAVAPHYGSYNAYQRKLHELNVQKFLALENYLEAWGNSERGPNRAGSTAEKAKSQFLIAQTNEALDILLTGGGSLASIARVEMVENRMKKNTRNHEVTSQYLLIDDHRVKRGEPIWIFEVASGFARVMHMGRRNSSAPLCGWISIEDLEKRSTWRLDPTLYPAQPPVILVYRSQPRPPTRFIIVSEIDYLPRYRRYPRGRHNRHQPGLHRPPRHRQPSRQPLRRQSGSSHQVQRDQKRLRPAKRVLPPRR